MKENLKKIGIVVGGFLGVALFGLIVYAIGWLNHVKMHELGYKWDARTGQITVLPRTGWFSNPPIVTKVNTIDLRPTQLCISANKRTLNCKLVKFNKNGLELFLSWHGRDDYDISSDAEGSLRDFLKSYAFDASGAVYPFLTILPSASLSTTQQNQPAPTPDANAPAPDQK